MLRARDGRVFIRVVFARESLPEVFGSLPLAGRLCVPPVRELFDLIHYPKLDGSLQG
jgi:hypothetical protein